MKMLMRCNVITWIRWRWHVKSNPFYIAFTTHQSLFFNLMYYVLVHTLREDNSFTICFPLLNFFLSKPESLQNQTLDIHPIIKFSTIILNYDSSLHDNFSISYLSNKILYSFFFYHIKSYALCMPFIPQFVHKESTWQEHDLSFRSFHYMLYWQYCQVN